MADQHGAPQDPAQAPAVARYRRRIRELGDAAADLDALLTVLISNCERVCRELDEGLPVLDSVRSVADDPARTFRRDLHAATTRFEHAMQSSRGESMAVLVREGGLSVAGLARMTGLSSQMVRRLMRSAEDA
jgi:hypothetical protein